MKQFCLFILLILVGGSMNAQLQTMDNTKSIVVNGSAEMNIPPDELELEIQLQEYDKAGHKVKLEAINKEFYKILAKHHIDTAALKFQQSYLGQSWYWWHWWQRRGEAYQQKTIKITLTQATNLLKLVGDLNEKWVQSISIAKSTHSKIYEYRKEVKKEAAKMAKEKAAYLLESLGEELGAVLSVEEIPDGGYYGWYGSNTLENTLMNSNIGVSNRERGVDGANDITLRYEVRVRFAIR